MIKKLNKQSSSLIEQVQQDHIAVTIKMFNVTNILQKIQESNFNGRLNSNVDSCSVHKQKKGEYFQTESPWMRYCQNCALNLALCGKKIQKSLNSEQMITKIKLCETLKSISQVIKISEQSLEQYSFLSNQLQQVRQSFVSILSQIDNFLSQLTEIRNLLDEHIQTGVNKEIKEVFEKQSLLLSQKIQLIHEKSLIECGFTGMIGQQNGKETAQTIEKSKILIESVDQLIVNQTYKIDIAENIRKIQQFFAEKLALIKNIELAFPLTEKKSPLLDQSLKISTVFDCRVLNFKNRKTSKTLQDDLSHEQCKRLLTACSTVQNSSLVSPSEPVQGVLNQMNQNLRHARTVLQLKTRCRSKSGQKKIQVNVRTGVQNVVRKKLL